MVNPAKDSLCFEDISALQVLLGGVANQKKGPALPREPEVDRNGCSFGGFPFLVALQGTSKETIIVAGPRKKTPK